MSTGATFPIEKVVKAALGDGGERYRRVFEQSPLGIAVADPDGRLHEANPALSRMLEYSAEELAGLCYLDIVHKDDRDECERQSRAAAAGEIAHVQLEGRFVRKSGDPISVKLNIS